MPCIPADDAFLVSAWPGVVVRTGERWLVTVDPALVSTGVYTVTMGGLPFQYAAAVPPDTSATIVQGLLVPLGLQFLASASPQGLSGILLQEIPPAPPAQPGGLAVTASGPIPDAITATLVSGGDGNATQRAYWLEWVRCQLPGCDCVQYCGNDYMLMYAALAAHWIYLTMPANIGSTGAGANDFRRMRLGPGELEKALSTWAEGGAAADADLARTVPGQFFLALRRKYVFPIMCA